MNNKKSDYPEIVKKLLKKNHIKLIKCTRVESKRVLLHSQMFPD